MKHNLLICLIVVAGLLSCQKDGQNDQEPESKKDEVHTINKETEAENSARPALGSDRLCGRELAQFSLTGKTFTEATDIIGLWHNEYLEKTFSDMVQVKLKPQAPGFKEYLHAKTYEIFSGKGIRLTELPLSKKYDFLNPAINIDDQTGYSAEAKNILKRLIDVVNTKCAIGDETASIELKNLKASALNLPDQREALAVGVAISVAINSNSYWKTNAGRWFEYVDGPVSAKNKLNVRELVMADGMGAIDGALGGGMGGGIAGAVAGAIVGASASSLLNCFSQALGWLVSWW